MSNNVSLPVNCDIHEIYRHLDVVQKNSKSNDLSGFAVKTVVSMVFDLTKQADTILTELYSGEKGMITIFNYSWRKKYDSFFGNFKRVNVSGYLYEKCDFYLTLMDFSIHHDILIKTYFSDYIVKVQSFNFLKLTKKLLH